MRPGDLGQFVGALVTQMVEQDLSGIHDVVRRNRKATHLNLFIAYAWMAQVRMEQLVQSQYTPEAVRMMLAVVMKRAMQVANWNYEAMSAAIANRFEGYDTASSDEDGIQPTNIVKYFVACCEDLRPDVQYDDMIPDPKDLEILDDIVDKEALAELKRLHREERRPTYSMRGLDMQMVGVSIFSIGHAVEQAVAKFE